MDLNKNGKLLCGLRKNKGMTQKQVAERLGVQPKTVSKWETGRGFPDVSTLSALADILGVSERMLLSGDLIENNKDIGNMKKMKFYVCPDCGSIMQGVGESTVICCGKPVEPEKINKCDREHLLSVCEIENDFYIEFNHEMTKEHFISFVSYVACDRVLTVKLYPEQAPSVRFPKMHGGKLYYYCNQHGLYECLNLKNKKQ
ncbi:MAG: helix-turn-helix domain-containing protein [Christensenellaceae bacterium]